MPIDYAGQGFNMPVESLNWDAIAKATRKPPTEAELARGKQREREKLPDELDRINDLIDFHTTRAEWYKNDRDEIAAKIASMYAAITELEPLAPSRGSIRDRIAEQLRRIESLQQHELRVATEELDKHTRLLAVNRKLKEDFPMDELRAYLKEQKILANAGL